MSTPNGKPPATGEKLMESVRSLHEAIGLLSKQNEQLLANVAHLSDCVHQLGLVVRFEQDTTRRAMLIHWSGEGLDVKEKERGA